MVKYLFTLYNKPDIHVDEDRGFRNACYNGHLELAKWILSYNDNYDKFIIIRADDDFAFKWACKNRHIKIAEWLADICDDYKIDCSDNFIYDW